MRLKRFTEAELDYRLCYVDGRLWFTSDMDKQWGDDWDDAPWDCNAGAPYTHETKVVSIYLEGIAQSTVINNCSVQRINRLRLPWLATWDDKLCIHAGTTLREVLKMAEDAGNALTVYAPVEFGEVSK